MAPKFFPIKLAFRECLSFSIQRVLIMYLLLDPYNKPLKQTLSVEVVHIRKLRFRGKSGCNTDSWRRAKLAENQTLLWLQVQRVAHSMSWLRATFLPSSQILSVLPAPQLDRCRFGGSG